MGFLLQAGPTRPSFARPASPKPGRDVSPLTTTHSIKKATPVSFRKNERRYFCVSTYPSDACFKPEASAVESQCRAARLPDAAAACPSSGITSVLLRLGTSPTGMTLITFIAAVSTTDTDFIEAFDT